MSGDKRPSCANCAYSQLEKHPQIVGQTHRTCHRNPPLVHAVPSPQGLVMATVFPPVADDQWCAEHPAIRQHQPQSLLNCVE